MGSSQRSWYEGFDAALADAGYGSAFETPVFEMLSKAEAAELSGGGDVSSAVDASVALENAIDRLRNEGLSPEEAVVELEDPDGFAEKFNIYV